MAAATARQIAANRQNARLSTGPVTAAGKAASRGNAVVHGLSGAGVVLAEDEAIEVERRCAEWAAVLRPVNVVEMFHVRQYAVESVRLERCQAQERELMDRRARRALDPLGWDEDRRFEAEEQAAHLARHPARTARRLRQTAQGCDWLIRRWRGLLDALASGRPWDETERSLALDLLGTPRNLRSGPTPADPAPCPAAGRDAETDNDDRDPAAPQRALAAGRIAELERLRDDVMRERDDDERAAVIAGAEEGAGAVERALRLVRRYEAACQRRLRLAMDALLGNRTTRLGLPAVDHFRPEAKTAPSDPVTPATEPSRPNEPTADLPPPDHPTPSPPSPPTPSPPPDRPRGNRRWRRAQAKRSRQKAA